MRHVQVDLLCPATYQMLLLDTEIVRIYVNILVRSDSQVPEIL